jgi:hypothetical protein
VHLWNGGAKKQEEEKGSEDWKDKELLADTLYTKIWGYATNSSLFTLQIST